MYAQSAASVVWILLVHAAGSTVCASPTAIYGSRSPAGRGPSSGLLAATSSDPLSSVDFYFPFKNLQGQIQTANFQCPAPGGFYDTALSTISSSCPSDGTDNAPINPCCTQDMLTDLAGATGCIQSNNASLASSMQSATEEFLTQCQQAGVNGLSDPFSTSSSSAAPTTSASIASSSSSSSGSTTSSISTSTSSDSAVQTTTSLSSSNTSNAAPTTSASSTPTPSSAYRNVSLGLSGVMWYTMGAIAVTTLVRMMH